jgi:hypothetical protein
VGRGIRGLPPHLAREVLLYLPPRALRSAQCACRLFAYHVAHTAPLRRAAAASLLWRQRFELFMADEWGERLATLSCLPRPLTGGRAA